MTPSGMCTQGSSEDDSNPSPFPTLPRVASGMPHSARASSCHQGVLPMRVGWAHQDMQSPMQNLTLILKKHGLGERWAPQQTPFASISTSGLTSQTLIPLMSLFRRSLCFLPLPPHPFPPHSQLANKSSLFSCSAPRVSSPPLQNSGGWNEWEEESVGEGLHTRTLIEDNFHLSFGTWHHPPTSCLRLSTDSSFPLS
jgi:hypothetical protein